ncbi:hypothetical protein OPW41_07735 [Vibrio europaeus]|uniref:hypothetical protein n=1 Tax=Vibrio europaeus TaxID=300876 RepID=UPI00233E70EE|nr:hypothetical protein [Vibrio europaeus]MDC5757032.1 hypothetical protein [Vibrio europaeus]MDC5775572.1 hypothetical protein [Vibrio europaeus]MDC5794710.1 hypothetical protein [Vibrio europaeus]MDC5800981.1 hypothetical protein [Vibrio europaeus]MDC5816988.1 hypothetical protein [Vibrio europaeus]
MTVKVELNPNTWTLISSAAAGYMDNQTGSVVKYRVEDSAPSDAETFGHQLKLEKGIGWSRAVAKNIYGRTASSTGDIIVTEG